MALSGMTLVTLVCSGVFMRCVPLKLQPSFYERKTWKVHLATDWWVSTVSENHEGHELRGSEAVRGEWQTSRFRRGWHGGGRLGGQFERV